MHIGPFPPPWVFEYELEVFHFFVIMGSQGKHDQARPLYERAVAISEAELGSESIEFAIALNNLAALLRDQVRAVRVSNARLFHGKRTRCSADGEGESRLNYPGSTAERSSESMVCES